MRSPGMDPIRGPHKSSDQCIIAYAEEQLIRMRQPMRGEDRAEHVQTV